MNKGNQSGNKHQNELNRTEILRAVVADAESMGLRDKDKIEQLTSRVIERLEQPQTLPGMEELVPRSQLKRRRLPTRAEIQAIVNEILKADEPSKTDAAKTGKEVAPVSEPEGQQVSKKKEARPMTKQTTQVKPAEGINLAENALRVLERRYLKKDSQGNVIETPGEMFRRVAKAIASAELTYDPRQTLVPGKKNSIN
jgi:ribonucleoside-diphosphate reductase alpha chain